MYNSKECYDIIREINNCLIVINAYIETGTPKNDPYLERIRKNIDRKLNKLYKEQKSHDDFRRAWGNDY